MYLAYYFMLILKIVKAIDFRSAYKELAIPIIVLLILDVFCVVIVSDTTKTSLSAYEYALEFIYNSLFTRRLHASHTCSTLIPPLHLCIDFEPGSSADGLSMFCRYRSVQDGATRCRDWF